MDFIPVVFGLVGGLALFLYGMTLLSNGLKKAAGDKLKTILERMTRNRVKGAITGLTVTAIIQSSSITTVILVGLLNSGLMSLEQAVPVIIGAEIGTTITAQLIAFKVGALFFPLIAIGFAMTFVKRIRVKYAGQILFGFGLLFLGMNVMSTSVVPFKESQAILSVLAEFGEIPILGVLSGAIFTGIVQSSSATTGLVIAMGMQEVISLKAAIALILGANIGTCITALLASIGGTLSARRAALSHFFFNIFGVALFFPFLDSFVGLVSFTAADLPRQIANAHTIFNTSMTLIMLPFVGVLIFAVKNVLKGKEIKVDTGVKFLDKRTLAMPAIAISQAEKEVERMGRMALASLDNAIKAFKSDDLTLIKVVEKQEDAVDELDNAIEAFLVKITRKELSKKQAKRVAALTHTISDIERVSDHANNIGELSERKIREKLVFPKQSLKELDLMFRKSRDCYNKALNVMVTGNKKMAEKVSKLEAEIDGMQNQFEQNNFERMNGKKCSPKSSIVFAELIRNLERISDHAHNISLATTFGF